MPVDMPVTRLTYEEFAKTAREYPDDPFSTFVREGRVVYVYALTRDLCSGCEIQRPLYDELAHKIQEKYGERVKFAAIHVSQQEEFRDKLRDFRRMLRFAAYPTYLILLRTEVGILEAYRGIEPPMEEIARSIDIAMELANR